MKAYTDTRPPPGRCGWAAVLLCASLWGCQEQAPPGSTARPPASSPAASAAPRTQSSAPAAGSRSTTAAPSAAPAPTSSAQPPAPPPARCKAAGSKEAIKLTIYPRSGRGLAVDAGHVYLVGSWRDDDQDYGEIQRVPKDGAAASRLIRLERSLEDLHLDGSGLYILSGMALLRIALDGSQHEVLADRFADRLAVHGGYVYGVDDDRRAKVEHLVRIPTAGGAKEVLLTRPWGGGYGGTAARFLSLAVDDSGIYLGDHGGRIVKLSHQGDSQVVLAEKQFLAGGVRLTQTHVCYTTEVKRELHAVPKAGGQPVALGCLETWAHVADADNLYAFGRGTERRPYLFAFPASGGEPFKDPMYHGHLYRVVQDDECLYFTMVDNAGHTHLSAIAKPGVPGSSSSRKGGS